MPQNALPYNEVTSTQRVVNITANTVVKAAPGTVWTVSVLVAGSAAGGVYDAATVAAAASSNEIYVTPNTVGAINLNGFSCTSGIVVKPGTGQTIAISFR